MRRHTCRKQDSGNRRQISDPAFCLSAWFANGNPLMRTHTRSSMQGTGDRNQATESEAKHAPRLPAPTPARHRRPLLDNPTIIAAPSRKERPAHRRLPKPSSRLQRTRRQGTGARRQDQPRPGRSALTSKITKPITDNQIVEPLFLPPDPWLLNGGADRSRTDDLLNANQALSQLSYGPGFRRQDQSSDVGGDAPTVPHTLTSDGGPG